MRRWLWVAGVLPALALAQRPDEESMFGAPAGAADAGTPPGRSDRPEEDALFSGTATGPGAGPADAGVSAADNRDQEALTEGTIRDAFETGGEAVEDPLKIGGLFYLRTNGSGFVNERFLDSQVSAPTLVDGYFDARPNDRVRGMVLGRLSFDPTQPQGSAFDKFSNELRGALPALVNPDGSINQAAVQQLQRVLLFGAGGDNPSVALDQAWLRFDIARAAFLTVGKQHVKWGTSRIWNPTDYLTPTRRNPLAFVDLRLGASMVKVHVPWEEVGANFYAIGLLDNAGPANLFRNLGGALRAEGVLFKTAEVGASALFQQGRKPKYAVDISTPLGPVDVYAEAALKQGSDVPLWRCVTPEETACDTEEEFEQTGNYQSYQPEGWTPGVSGGVEWTFAYTDQDTATLGLEYFYNTNGYSDARLYPWLLLNGGFTPFYLGKHYAALYGALIGPGNWEKVAFLLFNLANLSDQSYVSRVNFTIQVLTYLTIEAFASVHYGRRGGEFRFGMDARTVQLAPGVNVDLPKIPTPLWDTGIGLRVSL